MRELNNKKLVYDPVICEKRREEKRREEKSVLCQLVGILKFT